MAKHDDEFEGRDTVTLTLDDDSELECIDEPGIVFFGFDLNVFC